MPPIFLPSTGKDLAARDQIALTNLRLMLQTAITTGALANGKQWELATDEWGTTSSNETYTAPGSLGYYSSGMVYGSDLIDGTKTYSASTTQSGSASNLADGNGGTSWVANSATESWWKVDFGAGTEKTLTKVEYDTYTGGANSTNVYIEGSNDDLAWIQLDALGTGFTSGQNYSRTFSNVVAYRYYRIRITWSSANAGGFYEVRGYEGALQNITLIPPAAVSLSAAPVFSSAFMLWKDDSGSAVLGTDLTIELSRDGGTTWTAGTIQTVAEYDATYSIIKARANVGGQPAGTSLTCRIKTLNNKAQRIAAPALYAEA